MAKTDLSSYLATNYLVADPRPTKKRKHRSRAAAAAAAPSSGLLITDDHDELSLSRVYGRNGGGSNTDPDDDAPAAVAGGPSRGFKKADGSNWKPISAASSARVLDETRAADAVIASAASEVEAAKEADNPQPMLEGGGAAGGVVKMSDGTHAGLQSAAALSSQLEQRRREERTNFELDIKTSKQQETVYRDATGRRIDVSLKRAEARRAAAEEEKARLAKEDLRGDVQKQEARSRRDQVEDARLMPVARGVDDVELNRELKGQRRWNDPMAQFLASKTTAGTTKGRAGPASAASGRPVYAGPAPPNRYGIPPGYRWDGVDRSTGFEAKRDRAVNQKDRVKGLEYEWQMDE